jgi:hypothetical protein
MTLSLTETGSTVLRPLHPRLAAQRLEVFGVAGQQGVHAGFVRGKGVFVVIDLRARDVPGLETSALIAAEVSQ